MSAPVNPPYTAREIVEILEKARLLGVRTLRLPGFEAAWELAPAGEQGDRKYSGGRSEKYSGDRSDLGPCPKCEGKRVRGRGGRPYCVPCYIENKERGGHTRSNRRW